MEGDRVTAEHWPIQTISVSQAHGRVGILLESQDCMAMNFVFTNDIQARNFCDELAKALIRAA